jgi:dihydrofolate reductase
MLEHDLVDELHLLVYPLTLGAGKRVFPNGATSSVFHLKSATPYPSGVVGLHYARER